MDKKFLLVGLVILIMLSITFFNKEKEKEVDKKGVYTIFYVDKIIDAKGFPQVFFHYYYENTRYDSKYPCPDKSIKKIYKEKRLFGKVIPFTTKLYACCNCTVPKEVVESPSGGWNTLPLEYCNYESRCQ